MLVTLLSDSDSVSCIQLFLTPRTVTSVHGILQTRILEWVTISFSQGSSQPRDRTGVSYIAGRFFTGSATREAHIYIHINISLPTLLSSISASFVLSLYRESGLGNNLGIKCISMKL